MSEWLPIETAPRDGTEIWVSGYDFGMVGHSRWVASAVFNIKWLDTEHDYAWLHQPTHWMQKQKRPEPPK